MNAGRYLHRIGDAGPRDAGPATLRRLHERHMLSVPFENLDIGRRPIVVDENAFVRKVVEERRGGFCYELNGAFGALLRELGFGIAHLSAGVAREKGGFGPEYDHLALKVTDDRGGTWLVDVGFGEGFMLPLRFVTGVDQDDPAGVCRIDVEDGMHVLYRQGKPQYRFYDVAHPLDEFAPRCRFHQTSPESSFTQGSVCSLATKDGRITLANGRLIVTERGVRTERDLSEEEQRIALRDLFGVTLPRAA